MESGVTPFFIPFYHLYIEVIPYLWLLSNKVQTMTTPTDLHEKHYITGLQRGDKHIFALLFKAYYKDLVLFGGSILRDRFLVEDIVQNVFLKLWNTHKEVEIKTSLKSYLLTAVRNSCLDEIRHTEIMREYEQSSSEAHRLEDYDTDNYILYSDLSRHLEQAIQKLPEQYGKVFRMSRLEGMKYKEIASKLSISERTVEVWISKALSLLHIYLKDFMLLLAFIL